MNKLKRIAEIRKEKGYTQQDMSVLMDLGLSTYQQKEQGVINWLLPDLIKIRRVLNVKIDDLKEVADLEKEIFGPK